MEPMVFAAWWIAGAATLTLAPLLYVQTPTHRRRALARTAQRMGFTYSVRDHLAAREWFARFPLLAQGGLASVRHVLHGSFRGHETIIFEVRPPQGHGGRAWESGRVTVVGFRLARARVPQFAIHARDATLKNQRNPADRGLSFSLQCDAFDQRYEVVSAVPEAARKLCTPRVLRHFVSQQGLAVEGGGDWMLVYRLEPTSPTMIKETVWRAYQTFRAFELG